MGIGSVLKTSWGLFLAWPKRKLLGAIEVLRTEYLALKEENTALKSDGHFFALGPEHRRRRIHGKYAHAD